MTTRCAPAADLRALEPADAPALAALFGRLSPDSRYLRYLAPVRALPDRLLARLAAVDHDGHEAVGAFVDGELVGVAHWFRSASDPEEADLSVEVADSHQRSGLGGLLLEELGSRARERGIRRFTALALSENHAVQALLRHAAWPARVRLDGPQMSIELALPAQTRPLASPGTSTACSRSASSGTTSRVRSWVLASTTGAAAPSR